MKKNQDKRKSEEEGASRDGAGPSWRKLNASGKKSDRSQITLVPLNLRSKF
jgi:hypothetical protein